MSGRGNAETRGARRDGMGGRGNAETRRARRDGMGGIGNAETRGARRGGRGGRDNAGSAGIGVVLELVDDSPNPIFQDGNVEVDQQSEALVGDAQIGVKLNGKKRSQFD